MYGEPRGGREVWHDHNALAISSLGGGDEEDAGAIAEAIRGYEQHHGLRELGERLRGSGRRGHDSEGRAEQDEGRGSEEE